MSVGLLALQTTICIHFVEPGVEVHSRYYWKVLLMSVRYFVSCQSITCFNKPTNRARKPVDLLTWECVGGMKSGVFIPPTVWPPNSPYLNLVWSLCRSRSTKASSRTLAKCIHVHDSLRINGMYWCILKMLNGKYSHNACIKYKFVDCEVNRTTGNELKMF